MPALTLQSKLIIGFQPLRKMVITRSSITQAKVIGLSNVTGRRKGRFLPGKNHMWGGSPVRPIRKDDERKSYF
jgi:hypothetical protein